MAALQMDGTLAPVAGGSTGTGLTAVQRLVDEGAYVFITGRRTAELDKASAPSPESGRQS